jgi:hypothetical protein
MPRKTKIIFITSFIVIIAIGLGFYSYIKNKKSSTDNTQTDQISNVQYRQSGYVSINKCSCGIIVNRKKKYCSVCFRKHKSNLLLLRKLSLYDGAGI